MSETYIGLVKEIFLLFAGNVKIVVAAFVVMLFFLLLPGHKKLKQYFLWPSVVVLLLINNPLTIHFIVQKGLMAYNRYVRLYWLLPIGFLLAYLCVQLISRMKAWRKYAAALLCVCVIVGTGSYMFTEESYTKMTNPYKVPDDVISICDQIQEDVTADGKKPDDVRIVVSTTYSGYIHQYDGRLKTLYGRYNDSPIYREIAANMMLLMDAPELDVEAITTGAREGDCDYIVVDARKPKIGTFKEYGYEKLSETKNYIIYKMIS